MREVQLKREEKEGVTGDQDWTRIEGGGCVFYSLTFNNFFLNIPLLIFNLNLNLLIIFRHFVIIFFSFRYRRSEV